MAAGEGRNRPVLRDIGNLVTFHEIEGKQQQIPQVPCPVTRGFCAQLLANGQAASVENNKKQRAVVGDGAAEVIAPHKHVYLKKVTVKTKPEDIIIIYSRQRRG